MDKNASDRAKSPHPRDKSMDETHSRKSKCSTSEDCSKSVTGSEYFIHYDCSGTPTTKSSMSHNEALDWHEFKTVLDNTKHLEEKHKIPFRCRFPDKASMKSRSNIHSEHGCMLDDEMKKPASTQRSEAESYVHNEMFERKMHEMRELYDLRIKRLHDKLDRANQSNQLMKNQMTKMTKEFNTSMLEVQRDNATLRCLIKNLSKKSMPDSEHLQKIGQLESYVVMWQRKCQAETAKLKELQMLQNQQDNEMRNLQAAHSEKMLSLMKDYQNKLEEMEKSYTTQINNLELDHQEMLAERDNEIKRLHSDIHQQCLKMEHDMNMLRDKKNKDNESFMKDLEMQLKTAENKRDMALKFLEGPFFNDFVSLVKENQDLKILLINHSTEAWDYVFNEALNFSKEIERLNGTSEKLTQNMEARIINLREGRHDMGDFQDM